MNRDKPDRRGEPKNPPPKPTVDELCQQVSDLPPDQQLLFNFGLLVRDKPKNPLAKPTVDDLSRQAFFGNKTFAAWSRILSGFQETLHRGPKFTNPQVKSFQQQLDVANARLARMTRKPDPERERVFQEIQKSIATGQTKDLNESFETYNRAYPEVIGRYKHARSFRACYQKWERSQKK